MSVADAAVAWQQAGVSTIPILPNGTKRPAVKWAEFQGRIPTLDEVNHWWANGLEYGLALIMGQVSGNVEMTELEGDAVNEPGVLKSIIDWCTELGAADLWEMLASGYLEQSPSGGLHFIYRIGDQDAPGNTKIAMRGSGMTAKVLAETRGEGGYVIVAPTPGVCHPSGVAWQRVGGEYGVLPCISWEQRNLFHEAIQRALGVYAEPRILSATENPPTAPAPVIPSSGAGADLRPGDDFEERVDWGDQLLLGGAGWTLSHEFAGTRHWVRPGKDRGDGSSATTGHDRGRDRLYVFTTSQSTFPVETPITKFRAFSLLHFGGDDSAAAGELRRLHYGGTRSPGQEVAVAPDFRPDSSIEEFELTDMGNALRFVARVGQWRFRWIPEQSCWYHFNGQIWEKGDRAALIEARRMTEDMIRTPGLEKWGRRSQGERALPAILKMARVELWTSVDEFNSHKDCISTQNCTIDLATGGVRPHDPRDMITKMVNAKYDPTADAPKFGAFMEQILPDETMRGYVQRALGRTLLGDPGGRSMFFIYGPSGTGKTQFLELFQHIFGDYGRTAAPSTFRLRRYDQGASPELHELRGRRFVSSSETSDVATFDEEIIKRITGGDTLTTRSLYQEPQSWRPECTVWLATNFPPRLTGDDDAVWRRMKLIPFVTRVESDREIANYAMTQLVSEADGILLWLLDGVRQYQQHGLQEPESVNTAATELREETDPVSRFFSENEGDGILTVAPEERIRALDLYNLYVGWSQRNNERALVRRRFLRRAEIVLDLKRLKSNGVFVYVGVGHRAGAGIAGTWVPDVISP